MHDWKFAILKKNNIFLVVVTGFWKLHLHSLSFGVGLLAFASLYKSNNLASRHTLQLKLGSQKSHEILQQGWLFEVQSVL